MSAKSMYLKWRRQHHVGCVFARLIAGKPSRYGQKIEHLQSKGTPKQVASAIARRLDRLVVDPSVSSCVLLLTGVTTLEGLCRIALALNNHPQWGVTTTMLDKPPAGDFVGVHIVREIPFGGATCPSEALVLGPFEEFPATRRAPMTALEIFVGEPREKDPKDGVKLTTKANLAHIELNLASHKAFQIMWASSINGRAKSLDGAVDHRAKAKVSFVIPLEMAQQLGCAP